MLWTLDIRRRTLSQTVKNARNLQHSSLAFGYESLSQEDQMRGFSSRSHEGASGDGARRHVRRRLCPHEAQGWNAAHFCARICRRTGLLVSGRSARMYGNGLHQQPAFNGRVHDGAASTAAVAQGRHVTGEVSDRDVSAPPSSPASRIAGLTCAWIPVDEGKEDDAEEQSAGYENLFHCLTLNRLTFINTYATLIFNK